MSSRRPTWTDATAKPSSATVKHPLISKVACTFWGLYLGNNCKVNGHKCPDAPSKPLRKSHPNRKFIHVLFSTITPICKLRSIKYNPKQCLPLLNLSLPSVKTGDLDVDICKQKHKDLTQALGFVSREGPVSCFYLTSPTCLFTYDRDKNLIGSCIFLVFYFGVSSLMELPVKATSQNIWYIINGL